jgi:hypothetical protein
MAHEQPEAGWRKFVAEANTATTTGFTPAPVSEITTPSPLPGAPHISPSFDVVELLPQDRKDLLRKIRQHADDACALAIPYEDVRAASMERVEKENALRRLTDHRGAGGFNLPETDRRVILAQQALTKAIEDQRRLQERSEARAAAQQAALRVKAGCEDFLSYGLPGGTVLEAVEIEPPALLKNEAVLDAAERLRRRGRELRADIARLSAAPFPSSYAKQRMREQIETLAQRGEPSVSRLVELDGPVEFQTTRLTSEVHAERRLLAFTAVEAAIPTLAWLHKDALIKRLDELIDAEADDGAAISHADREILISETQMDLLSVEREESFFVWQAQSENLPIERRADCDQRAILQIQLLQAPRADETGTTPGLSWPWRR